MPYFTPVQMGGVVYPLDHLEPFTFDFHSERAKRNLRVHVTYSNHCYTKKYDPVATTGWPTLLDARRQMRVFCPVRYRLSHGLPAHIAALNNPGVRVWETARERNWCHTLRVESIPDPYYVFFDLARATAALRHRQELRLTVESAYPQGSSTTWPRLNGSMAFQLLCGKVFLGERTHTRR
ncbi:hypothetical protein C7R54_22555 [Achromobacter aloeverae]|uniref:Uncharacterized protein n=1 Tax=Achromobacter aloeverae TaxID=1750518 RepID=A0A4Q1HHJ1_9BURK|nr:hypothetical protein C7R54_22555 [Achromobacter aloeverae]